MKNAFVWFHNHNTSPTEAVSFYEKLLGWRSEAGPPGMTMFAGDQGPFAAVGRGEGGIEGWVPFAQVDDVDAATQRAVSLGARVLQEKRRGPAGEFSIVRDPGGATIALWQKV